MQILRIFFYWVPKMVNENETEEEKKNEYLLNWCLQPTDKVTKDFWILSDSSLKFKIKYERDKETLLQQQHFF